MLQPAPSRHGSARADLPRHGQPHRNQGRLVLTHTVAREPTRPQPTRRSTIEPPPPKQAIFQPPNRPVTQPNRHHHTRTHRSRASVSLSFCVSVFLWVRGSVGAIKWVQCVRHFQCFCGHGRAQLPPPLVAHLLDRSPRDREAVQPWEAVDRGPTSAAFRSLPRSGRGSRDAGRASVGARRLVPVQGCCSLTTEPVWDWPACAFGLAVGRSRAGSHQGGKSALDLLQNGDIQGQSRSPRSRPVSRGYGLALRDDGVEHR